MLTFRHKSEVKENGVKQIENIYKERGNKNDNRHLFIKLAEKFGGVALTSKTKNRDDVIRGFKNGDIKLLFTHPKLLGKGATFTNCTYNVYYSLSKESNYFGQSY